MPQMVNGSKYDGSVTICNRMTERYAVVNSPECGKHKKTEKRRKIRHMNNVCKKEQK